MCVTFLQNPEKQTVWLSAAVYLKKDFGKFDQTSGFTVEEPGSPVSYLLVFSIGEKETNLEQWFKESIPGFFWWPKECAKAFSNACVDYLKNFELPSEDRPKSLYSLIEKLAMRDHNQNSVETAKSIEVIVKTALSMSDSFKSFRTIQGLIAGVKKQKDITLKQIASFCLAAGRLPLAEELATKNMYNNRRVYIIR